MTVSQPYAIIEMVAAGFDVGIFPRWAVNGSLPTTGVIARPITWNGLPLTWYATYLGETNIPIFQNEFLNIVSKLHLTNQA
jgi:DNA-binding transcriptional LysR family regulator